MTRAADKSIANPPQHPYVPPETGDAPFGTVPRRSRGVLVFWICTYVVWLGVLLAMAWQRFRHA
ncbi:MAG: hypothetical protein JNG88_17105 [Phycisphaerales bacterium]|nr:hypothetical protein [Phycisphaerales bacterium]